MTYNKDTAEVEPRTKEEWLNLILDDGSEHWGEDITERDGTAIHKLYEPFAGRLAELEQELKEVHLSLRVKDAEGQELDYLGNRLGVSRREVRRSTGEVTFSRESTANKDYLIQQGTVLNTGGTDPVEFETTEGAILEDGTSSVTVPIEAVEPGSKGNVAANTITESAGTITGVDSVTNNNQTAEGRDIEQDENYRNRIKTSVGSIDVASGQKIYNKLTRYEYIKEVQYIDNSTDSAQQNLNAHEVELVIDSEAGHRNEIAQTIYDNLAMGANLVNGSNGDPTNGTASLPNGQTFTVPYSVPTEVTIHVDVDVETDISIADDILKRAIVEYIGGVKPNGQQIYGDLNVGDDVLYGEVDFSLRDVENVYDVTSLKIGTSSSPTGTSNITISSNERARIHHTNIDLTKTVK